MQADGQADTTKLMLTFCNCFVNVPKNPCYFKAVSKQFLGWTKKKDKSLRTADLWA
jgi:hypothetical protein